ncbi:acetyl-CoA sensor PanZ family protein, partial [Yersinia bercovieri]|uniref:acetyl-CoA sensor PanZ family protein n=1 Tax=Yersinia bercovieri TaxID=634 RepID=UPI0011A55522
FTICLFSPPLAFFVNNSTSNDCCKLSLPAVQHWALGDEQVTAENRAAIAGFMHACGFSRSTQGWQR